ncbi:MAG TPA: response regulator [Dehalococcoidia bacterium]|nr:response regulator [Dehalococcoidia bacterium]
MWTSETQPQPPYSVLVIDDDTSLLTLLRILLTASGYAVTTATGAAHALDLAERAKFDLVLLDLEMPGMDGRDFYAELRQRGIDTPVVIVSAYGAEAARAQLGANGAIAKPFDPADLSRTVRQVIERTRGSAQA